MNKTIKIYLVFLVLLLVAIIIVDANRPKPIDWTPTFGINDRIPFGMHIFDKESSSLLKNDTIEKTTQTAYEYLDSRYYYIDDSLQTDNARGTFLAIAEYYDIDDESTNELLYHVAQGNSVFLSATSFSEKLEDSLHFNTNSKMPEKDGLDLNVVNPSLGTKKYNFVNGIGSAFFSKIDTLKTTVLGYQSSKKDKEKQINFIKIAYKKGFFYLHCQPIVFTNYHLLKEDHYQYTEKIASYIPKGKLIWLVKGQTGDYISNSPLRYILSQPSLRYAWYLFLIGIIVFMIFNAKRRQRIVPIIKPLSNTTVDFTKTIGNLYFQEGDHQNIIDKKIIFFLEKIRNDYLIETAILDDNFIKKLHLKSGKDIDDIKNVVRLINYQRKSYNQSIEDDLLELNNAIEKILN
jgi:hypothetical protein